MTDPLGLSFNNWPAVDRTMWGRLVRSAGLFDELGTLQDLSAITLRELRATYGYYLGYLRAGGVDLDSEPLSRRVTSERLRGWVLTNERRVATSSQSVYAARLLTVLRAGFLGQDLSLLETASRKLARRAKREQRHDISPGLPDAATVVRLGRDLIALAERDGPCDSVLNAEHWRDGLMILFLVHHANRAGELEKLVLGETLLKTCGGYRVSFSGAQTKTGKPMEFGVAPEVGRLLDRYLAEIRPLFPAPTRSRERLWLTRRGTALAAKGLGRRVGDVTEAALGIRVSPHDFRRIAANTVVMAEGAEPLDASALLGHADPRITRRHYITAGSLQASQRLGRLVTKLQRTDEQPRRKRRSTG